MRVVTICAAVALAACGGAARSAPPAGPAPEAKQAIAEAGGLAREIERGLARGHAAGLSPLCAVDLVALGPRGADHGRGRTDTLIALGDALPGKKHRIKVRDRRVDSAPGARSAWLTQQLDVDGKRHAVTAIAAEVDGLWVITAVNVGATLPARALRGERGSNPPPLARLDLVAGVAAGNRAAPAEPMAAFERAVDDVDARLAQLDGERAVVLGPGERAAWRGARAIRRAWKKQAPRWRLTGDARAAATPDGELVWIAATAGAVEPGGPERPRRLFAVYRRDAAGWRLAVLHESVMR